MANAHVTFQDLALGKNTLQMITLFELPQMELFIVKMQIVIMNYDDVIAAKYVSNTVSPS